MSQQLIEALISDKILLNQFKHWINLSSNEDKLLETTKYEFITHFVSNIHLSTHWLTTVLALNCNQINSRSNSLNSSPVKSFSNGSSGKSVNNGNDNKINPDLIERKLKTRNRKLITTIDLTKKVENIDLSDENLFPTLGSEAIVPKGVANNAKTISETSDSVNTSILCRRKRRIKPTAIKGDEQISLGFFTNSRDSKGKPIRKEFIKNSNNLNIFESKSDNNSINSESNDSLKAEREWLKRAKANDKTFNKTEIDIKVQKTDSINKLVTIEANPDLITYSNELKVISSIYAIILKSNFVPNFFDELKFICELSTKRVTKEYNEEISHKLDSILSSIHNCIYFSVSVLEELLLDHGLIECLNRTTLKLLAECSNITNFSSTLREKLLSVLESRKPSNNADSFRTTLESVFFQSETDNKCNFPNDQSFHAFRKQRDEFYQIYNSLRQKNNSINDTKDSHLKFVNSIKHLLSFSRDSGNMPHLSRLFVSQLIQSCVGRQLCSHYSDNNEETTDDNETVRNLFPDRERLKKLQKRFNKSSSTLSDINLFSKDEQFFRDFIFYGDSHAFNEHLKLLLSQKLLEFNNNELLDFDNDFSEIQVLRNRLRNNLITLKVISKFLAYVTFYPFDTTLSQNNVQEFIDSQTSLRSQTKPIIDLEKCLNEAIDKQKVLVTIPWIVEFLSFIDPISSRTVYYKSLYNLLVVAYKSYLPIIIQFNSTNGLFIMFYMNRILSDKNFNNFYQIIFDSDIKITDISSSKDSIDFVSGVIDNELIDEFCPHFNNELTKIFKQNVVNEVRKITPLTMPLIDNSKQLNQDKNINNSEHLLRLQIEEQFFNSHSPSLKKTVDFLSDRVTSKCIKQIKTETFIKLKQPYIQSDSSNYRDSISEITSTIQSECKNFVKHYCEQQISSILPQLMNEDIEESVIQFSIKIAIKLTIDKCFNWIDSNITPSLIENDLKAESENKKRQTNIEKLQLEVDDKEKLVDISSTFTAIRDLMADLYENKPINDSSIIVRSVNQLTHLRRSKTLPKKTLEFIDINVVDFAMALIANQPKLLNDSTIKLFIDYWLEFNIMVEKFVCPRNLYILYKCKSPYTSWSKFESFLLNMLSSLTTTTQIIENDSLWTLKEEWNDSVLNRFASCLKSIVNFSESREKRENSDMLNTIDWLSWFCSQSDGQQF